MRWNATWRAWWVTKFARPVINSSTMSYRNYEPVKTVLFNSLIVVKDSFDNFQNVEFDEVFRSSKHNFLLSADHESGEARTFHETTT